MCGQIPLRNELKGSYWPSLQDDTYSKDDDDDEDDDEDDDDDDDDDVPIIYNLRIDQGFSIAMFNYQRVSSPAFLMMGWWTDCESQFTPRR